MECFLKMGKERGALKQREGVFLQLLGHTGIGLLAFTLNNIDLFHMYFCPSTFTPKKD